MLPVSCIWQVLILRVTRRVNGLTNPTRADHQQCYVVGFSLDSWNVTLRIGLPTPGIMLLLWLLSRVHSLSRLSFIAAYLLWLHMFCYTSSSYLAVDSCFFDCCPTICNSLVDEQEQRSRLMSSEIRRVILTASNGFLKQFYFVSTSMIRR